MVSLQPLPSDEQRLLLQAAFLPEPEALEAWNRWNTTVDLQAVDYGTARLLPLAHKRLGGKRHESSIAQGMQRRSWFHHQIMRRELLPLLRLLESEEIPVMAIKGWANLCYYSDPGLRPMWDIDLAVPVDQVESTLELLCETEWKPNPPCSPRALATVARTTQHAWNFKRGHADIDLHWHILQQDPNPHHDERVWKCAQKRELQGVEIYVPCPTDQLIQACMSGMRWRKTKMATWLADAALIVQSDEEVDWSLLLDVARRRRLTLPLYYSLEFLATELRLAIPGQILQALKGARTHALEREAFRAMVSHPLERSTKGHRAMKTMGDLRREGPDVLAQAH